MPQKILVIGPAWVGDMVMAQSLFKLLKQHDASNTLDVLAPNWTFPLLSRMPEVSIAINLPFAHGQLQLATRYQFAQTLKARVYDQAIVLPNSFKSALIPWMAKIPKRSGWLGEFRYLVLNDIRYDKKSYPLMIEQFMALALPANSPLPSPYPYPSLHITATAQQTALAKHQPAWRERPVLALCPGAEYGPAKRWPEEYFAQIANKKIAEGWDVWLLGSQKDGLIIEKIMQLTQGKCANLSGQVDLAEKIDLLSLVSGVVTNDSGLMHIAAALNKPLVALYGSTSPKFTPPLSKQATILKLDLPCQPCFKRDCPLGHHRCMRDLTPDAVLATISAWGIE